MGSDRVQKPGDDNEGKEYMQKGMGEKEKKVREKNSNLKVESF